MASVEPRQLRLPTHRPQQGSKSARNHSICQCTCFLPLHLLSCCCSVHFVCGMHTHAQPRGARSQLLLGRVNFSLSHPLWMVWALLLMCSSLAPGYRSRMVRTPRWLRHDLQSYLHMHKCKPQHTSAGSDWLLVNLKYEYISGVVTRRKQPDAVIWEMTKEENSLKPYEQVCLDYSINQIICMPDFW